MQLRELFVRHPRTTIIWAHAGLGRVVRPVPDQLGILERALSSPELKHLHIDLSWDQTAKYIVASPETITAMANLINRYPDRFLFGSDVVAPKNQPGYLEVFRQYEPLWGLLGEETKDKMLLGNYERLFDEARRRVRAWERA